MSKSPNWFTLCSGFIFQERTVREIIPKLKAARAEDIVEYPLNKIVA